MYVPEPFVISARDDSVRKHNLRLEYLSRKLKYCMSFLPSALQRSLCRTVKFPRVSPWPPTYPRTFSLTAWRIARYVRFGQPTPQPRNLWDYRQWGPRVQLGAVIFVFGTGYYVTQ